MQNTDIQLWAEQARRLFELINPDQPERAEDQYQAFLDELEQLGEEQPDNTVALMWLVKDIIDGESGYCVSWRGKPELIEAIGQIVPDEEVVIDWGGDPEDDGFLTAVTVPDLLRQAHASLEDAGYTLWCWQTENDSYMGWLTRRIDESELSDVAFGLGIVVRMADEPF